MVLGVLEVGAIKPLYTSYQKDLSNTLWEPLNTFWAECYESCKLSSQRRAKLQMESRRKFQERILVPCRIRQSEENARLTIQQTQRKAKDANTDHRWLNLQRFLYGPKGAWTKEFDLTKDGLAVTGVSVGSVRGSNLSDGWVGQRGSDLGNWGNSLDGQRLTVDDGVESVDGIGGVLNDTTGAIGLNQRVRSSHNISRAGFLL
uniref:Uncharacterized protein n=1 Tax=Anopheles maculatus TaxID=74869 RepID=A0A182S6I5_9DIPT